MSQQSEPLAGRPAKSRAFVFGLVALVLITLVTALVIQYKREQSIQGVRSQLYPGGMESTKVSLPNPEEWKASPEEEIPTPSLGTATHQVTIETEKGTIIAELYGKDAPKTVENFVTLIGKKFYDGLTFHRVEPGFVIQGGDPAGDGTGDPGFTIPMEVVPGFTHEKGVLAMARLAHDLDSAGCQFYITLDPAPHLDGGYAIFGKVVKGMSVAEQIKVGDTMTSVTVEEVK